MRKKLKAFVFFRFLPGLALIALTFLFHATPPARSADRVVTVGVYENAPKIFTAESGQPSGIFIDIIEHIAKSEGWALRYVPGSWAEGLDRLAKGEIDFMPDVARTADREKRYAFHKIPVLSSWSQVYASKDSRIQSILDLNGKRVLVLENSVQQETFDRLTDSFGLNTTLIAVPDYKTMFDMVARREAEAAITNRFYGLMHARKSGLQETPVLFDPSSLFFAAPRRASDPLQDTIDRHLSVMIKDPRSIYYASLKRWTSEAVKFELPAWMQLLSLIVGVVLLGSLAGSAVLKHQVNARTRELRRANKEMEQRIIERTAELAAAMEKAQTADRLKSAFLATMSHELRTPLNSIIGFTGILLQGLAGALNPEQQKQMTMVQKSSRHLLALINDVLDISKIEAGQLELSVSSFEVRPSIEKMVTFISPLAEKKGIGLKVDLAEDIGRIVADQRRLEQVILNLLNNAVKFTEQGHVLISGRIENDRFLLSVVDSGIGMPPEELQNLFQPFHQLDTGLARKSEGTGLGLSICKKILDIMGGAIDVQSQLGKGSTFTVRFPIRAGDTP